MENNFEILEKISESPTTVVYKAEQKALGRHVLLKVLHRHLLGDKDLVNRFSREARACAMLQSEHIVQVYDLEEVDGSPAIVMEFVHGESLKDFLNRTGERSEETARKVAEGVLTALSVSHAKGIVHRDIKPGNILISEKDVVKVTDFGLAWMSSSPSLTAEGALIGTPAYMSPEQARGDSLDHRTDLFSLGVTLIEIVTGVQMFGGSSYSECLNKILSFRTETIPELKLPVSDPFRLFLTRLLAVDPNDRFTSAAEALRVLTGSGPPSRPTLMSSRVGFAVGSAGILIAAGAFYLFVFAPASDFESDPQSVNTTSTYADSAVMSDSSSALMSSPEEEPQSSPPASRQEPASTITTIQAQPETEPERSDSGFVTISAQPWASVYIDNEFIGTTPIATSVRVSSGTHQVTFNNPLFVPITRSIDVEPNTQTPVEANFLETAGFIVIDAKPWAEVYIDDQFRETTPLSTPVVVSSGRRKLRLHHPSFRDFLQDLVISAGDTIRVNYDFTKSGGVE